MLLADVTEPMVVQLALQSAALRETGMDVVGAAVQFTELARTRPVSESDGMR